MYGTHTHDSMEDGILFRWRCSQCMELVHQIARMDRESFDLKKSKVDRAIKDGSTIFLWVLLPTVEYFFPIPKCLKTNHLYLILDGVEKKFTPCPLRKLRVGTGESTQ